MAEQIKTEEVLHSKGQPKLNFKPLTDESSNLHGNLGQSPSQTVGPYFHQGLVHKFQDIDTAVSAMMVEERSDTPGERIVLTGKIYDADGVPIPDAMIELWQPGADGIFVTEPGVGFNGFGRGHTRTDDYSYTIRTIKPGRVGGRPPRLAVWLGMRGLLTHLITFIYFSDEDNSADPVLNAVPEARRGTLIARRGEGQGDAVYTFDIRMQGEGETAFFDAY